MTHQNTIAAKKVKREPRPAWLTVAMTDDMRSRVRLAAAKRDMQSSPFVVQVLEWWFAEEEMKDDIPLRREEVRRK